MRCVILDYPLSFIFTLVTATIITFAYFIRICEYDNPRYDFTNYYNCCWFTMVTMATIGYGDYLPMSPAGKLVAFILAVCGIIETNLIAVIVSGRLKLDDNEIKALNSYEHFKMRKRIVKDLMKIMVLAYKLKKALVLPENSFTRVITWKYFNQICQSYRGFIELRRKFESEKLREADQFTRKLEQNIKKAQFIDFNSTLLAGLCDSFEISKFIN